MTRRSWRPSREAIGWLAIAVVVVVMQWPMLKGMWYRRTAATPPPSAIAWHTDLPTALADARRLGRPVLVDFAADWCPPCITMKHDVWPDSQVANAVNAAYVPLLVDVDAQPEVAARYGVNGIPSVLVLDEDGAELRRATFLGASGMRRFLEDAD
jgi:thiol:disulfide interchange protein DsbD